MVLQRNKPLPTDILSDSQVDLFNNNNAIDDSFGLDHYASSNTTADNGKHRVLRMPVQPAVPLAPLDCLFYGFQDHATIGPMQYTRKPVDQVPTPVTCLQSSAVGINLIAGGITNILDFTGLPYCYGEVRAMVDGSIGATNAFYWDGANLSTGAMQGVPLIFNIQASGTVLRIQAAVAVNDLSWTLRFDRIFNPL